MIPRNRAWDHPEELSASKPRRLCWGSGEDDRYHPRMGSSPLTVGLLAFPDLTQLDLTGPYEVFSRAPGMRVPVSYTHLTLPTICSV